MAKGSTQKGMRMIGPTPGHRVKQLEVKTWRTGGRYRSRLVEVVIKQPDPTTPVHFPRSSPSKHSRSCSHKYFDAWADSAFNRHESMSPPVQQLMLPQKKTQNDYIHEWVPWKGEFLKILLELEASPEPRNCTWCGNDRRKPLTPTPPSSDMFPCFSALLRRVPALLRPSRHISTPLRGPLSMF
ncbi:hypothetical protein BKA82DRAFT_4017187 [Pisolithus tinctorius]|nr:hypothetical protein BKA82DRAFT_4017187 [Pisolithus tinctorius]